jgi:hypothetical protein
VGAFLSSLGRALAGQRTVPRFGVSLIGLWMICSTCLVAIYAAQELLEGLFATGHPAGLTGVFGDGGAWAIPAALCVGLVLAALLHGARWVLHEIATRTARPHGAPALCRRSPRRIDVLRRRAPLALGWSGRGPPR